MIVIFFILDLEETLDKILLDDIGNVREKDVYENSVIESKNEKKQEAKETKKVRQAVIAEKQNLLLKEPSLFEDFDHQNGVEEKNPFSQKEDKQKSQSQNINKKQYVSENGGQSCELSKKNEECNLLSKNECSQLSTKKNQQHNLLPKSKSSQLVKEKVGQRNKLPIEKNTQINLPAIDKSKQKSSHSKKYLKTSEIEKETETESNLSSASSIESLASSEDASVNGSIDFQTLNNFLSVKGKLLNFYLYSVFFKLYSYLKYYFYKIVSIIP